MTPKAIAEAYAVYSAKAVLASVAYRLQPKPPKVLAVTLETFEKQSNPKGPRTQVIGF